MPIVVGVGSSSFTQSALKRAFLLVIAISFSQSCNRGLLNVAISAICSRDKLLLLHQNACYTCCLPMPGSRPYVAATPRTGQGRAILLERAASAIGACTYYGTLSSSPAIIVCTSGYQVWMRRLRRSTLLASCWSSPSVSARSRTSR